MISMRVQAVKQKPQQKLCFEKETDGTFKAIFSTTAYLTAFFFRSAASPFADLGFLLLRFGFAALPVLGEREGFPAGFGDAA